MDNRFFGGLHNYFFHSLGYHGSSYVGSGQVLEGRDDATFLCVPIRFQNQLTFVLMKIWLLLVKSSEYCLSLT